MKIAFITNFCPHYRLKTFETLSNHHQVDYFFFSAGDEWYWQSEHGVNSGNFSYKYLPGFRIGNTRITPSLPWELIRGDYEIYIKCINGRFALPLTYLTARFRKKPFILWTGIWSRVQTPTHRLLFPITKFIYKHSDAIVVYGKHVLQYLISEGVQPERIFIAAHAVDNNYYKRQISENDLISLRNRLRIDSSHKVVLFLGRLEKVKGLTYLLEAFESIGREDAILVFAGTGSEQLKLNNMALGLGIADKVRFVGYVPVNQTPTYYALAWVVTLPSITIKQGKELWGLVVNEAFNRGVPVIASNSVGAAAGGLVEDGINGYIVPERDSQALSIALMQILENDDLREYMSKNARQKISNWDNHKMVKGFLESIKYVMS